MKANLKAELVARLSGDLAAAERAQEATREGATHEENKPENDKDTRALEQSYLARGQARRVDELRTELALVQGMPVRALPEDAPIALGALVDVEEEERERTLLIAPGGGGATLSGEVHVVTPSSPLGRALIGKRSGDDLELRVAGRERSLTVARVR